MLNAYLTVVFLAWNGLPFQKQKQLGNWSKANVTTVKPVHKDHPRDPKIVAAVDRWSMFKDPMGNKATIRDSIILIVVGKWSLFRSGCKLRFECTFFA